MKPGVQSKVISTSPVNRYQLNVAPHSAKSSSKRGISNDQIRDVPKYLTNNCTPQGEENPLKNLITQSEQGKPPKTTIITSTRNPNQIKPIINSPDNRVSHSMSPSKNMKSPSKSLLPTQEKEFVGKKTLVLDLDETLVHSSFNQFDQADIVLKIELEGKVHQIFVLKRPGVEEFLERMAKYYEIVIYTASLSKYADPLIDILDPNKFCRHRLFREHCSFINSVYIKDLTKLGRNIKDIIIIDNTPASYALQTECGIPIKSWYDDKEDRELYLLTPILEFLSSIFDIRDYLKKFIFSNEVSYKHAWQVINSHKTESQAHSKNVSKNFKDNSSVITDNSNKNEEELKISINNSQIPLESKEVKPEVKTKIETDAKMININIYNHNINHFIISPKDSKKSTNETSKNIKTFRSSYSNTNNTVKTSENIWSANIYSNKKSNKAVSDIGQKVSSPTTSQQANSSQDQSQKPNTSSIKIVTEKIAVSPKTVQTQRPSSAITSGMRSTREKSSQLKNSINKTSDSSIITRKDSANTGLKPINTSGNINRSDSLNSRSNTAKSQQSRITYNKNNLDRVKHGPGNNSARISSSLSKPSQTTVVKKPLGIKVSVTKNVVSNNISKVNRDNSRDSLNSSITKRSYSLSSRSQDKKPGTKNLKSPRLMDDPRVFDNKSNVSDTSISKGVNNNKYPSLKKKNIQIRVNSVNRNINSTPKTNNQGKLNIAIISYADKKLQNQNSYNTNILRIDTKK